MEEVVEFSCDESSVWRRCVEEEEEWGRWEKMVIRDIFNWRQLNFKGVINCITIDCHNTSKQLSYIKENLNLNFGQSENFILFSPVLFHPPSWIIVQSDDCFSICHLEFLSNHRLSCHLELLSNQKTAFHPASWIFDQSEMSCPPTPPAPGIELSYLHYWPIQLIHEVMTWNMMCVILLLKFERRTVTSTLHLLYMTYSKEYLCILKGKRIGK